MDRKVLIKMFIIILCISLVIILLVLYRLVDLKKNNSNIPENNNKNISIQENLSINNEIIDLENNDYIFYFEDETGNAKYSEEQLDNIEINVDIPEKILKLILNKEEFYLKIKEYIFLNGLVNSTEIKYQRMEEIKDKSLMKLYFILNNSDKDTFSLVINLNTNNIEAVE